MVELPYARDLDDPVKRGLEVAVGQKAHSQMVPLPAVVVAAAVEDELHLMAGHRSWGLRSCSVAEDLAGCSAAVLKLAEVASRTWLHNVRYRCDSLEKVIDLDGTAQQFETRDKAAIALAVDWPDGQLREQQALGHLADRTYWIAAEELGDFEYQQGDDSNRYSHQQLVVGRDEQEQWQEQELRLPIALQEDRSRQAGRLVDAHLGATAHFADWAFQ